MRQTAAEYAQEIRRWGRYSEEQIREAVTYALDRGTDKEGINSEEEKVCPWCGSPLDDPFACDHCDWGRGTNRGLAKRLRMKPVSAVCALGVNALML